MSFVFNRSANADWAGATTVRCLLERTTSSYSPNRDHDTVDDLVTAGLVEITVASYGRQSLTGRIETVDDANDLVVWTFDTLSFGWLESGQSIKGLVVYEQVGGNDATPGDDPVIAYVDGTVGVVLAADAAVSATTLWVEPLLGDLPSGQTLDFGGGATCTLSAAGSIGDRSLTVSALGAAATAGATATGDTQRFPIPLDNGLVTLSMPSFVQQVPR